jgi:hypothetical protein
MAVRGTKPKPAALRLVTGNPGKRDIPGDKGKEIPEFNVREEPLKPLKKLNKSQKALWDRFIDTAWWLSDHDVPKAYMWVCLQTEYLKAPVDMIASRIAQLRIIETELGLDASARARMGIADGKKKTDPTEKFFD